MKIIGNGMIAESFKTYNFKSVCVFASGVADSTENDILKYKKEYDLLKQVLIKNKNNIIVYFSTLSVLRYDYTNYVKHKLFMESYIENNSTNFLILRLPNVVGNTKNKKQLLPFMYNSLLNNDIIQVKNGTYRDLIDVDDLPKIVNFLINEKINGKLNITLDNKIKVIDIVNYLIKINNINGQKLELLNDNESILYDNHISKYYNDLNIKNLNTNPYQIIKKYYKK
jgi:nucleoside-diphosphate-sugar epimerase